jgi:rod shape-determining protein MreD
VRALIALAVALVAVIAQLTIVDRITWPGGTGPDLVLLAVAALALGCGPLVGALTGFCAGLALDVAPPASHVIGQYALVFCLIGYACGLLAEEPAWTGAAGGAAEAGHTALFEIVVTAAGAVCGEMLAALLGAMLSDPRVTWAAIRHVLPLAAAYDVLLCPFVLYTAAAALRLAGTRRERGSAEVPGPARLAGVASPGAIRPAGGSTPKLRLSERSPGEGWLTAPRGTRPQGAGGRPLGQREPDLKLGRAASRGTLGPGAGGRPAARREPNFKLGRGGLLGGSALGAAFAQGGSRLGYGPSGGFRPARSLGTGRDRGGLGGHARLAGSGTLGAGQARVRFGTRRREGVLGGSLLGGSRTARSQLGGSGFVGSRLGRSLLGGSVFSRSPSALNRTAPLGLTSGRTSWLGGSGLLGRSSVLGRSPSLRSLSARRRTASLVRPGASGTGAGHTPHFSRGGFLARLTAALGGRSRASLGGTALGHPAVRRSPGKGWLRGTSGRRALTGRGWGGGSAPRLRRVSRTPARLHMPRPKAKRRRTGGFR